MPRLTLILVFALLVATLPLGSRAAEEPFEIDVSLPITGQVAFLGANTAKGVRALEGFINQHGGIRGRPVKFNISDDQSNPAIEVQIVSQELVKKPAVIVGGELVAMCRAAAGLIKDESGPVYYCLTPGFHPPPGSWIFSGTFSTNDMLATSIRYLRERGLTKLAVINTTDASGQDGDRTIAAAIGAPGEQGRVAGLPRALRADRHLGRRAARRASRPRARRRSSPGRAERRSAPCCAAFATSDTICPSCTTPRTSCTRSSTSTNR